MEIPNDLLYTQEHEWVRVKDGRATVGITAFAQDQLGDVVFVELPKVDAAVEKESPFGVVESVKTVSDLFAPVSGKVAAVNKALESQPELVNADPYGTGWIMEMELSDAKALDHLLTPEGYAAFLKDQEQA
ncbi:MAG: glycine cleavage system protein GcvH [Nitrospinaceae bacterium]